MDQIHECGDCGIQLPEHFKECPRCESFNILPLWDIHTLKGRIVRIVAAPSQRSALDVAAELEPDLCALTARPATWSTKHENPLD